MNIISVAHAQDVANAAVAGGEASLFVQLMPLIIIFGIFYILVIRPQSKRIREHNVMIDQLTKGDKVVTGGGIEGQVKKVNDDTLVVEIAKGVEIKVLKQTISAKRESKK